MDERVGKRTGGGRPGRGVTLQDLADSLGVSKATVSNAYNRPDQLSADLRARILAEARRLGYTGPDPIAATFSRRRADAVGLVFDDPLTFALTDPAEVLFVTGIAAACEQAGVGLVLIPRGPSDDLVLRALVDGFVCHCDLDGDGRVDIAIARELPVVIVRWSAPAWRRPCRYR
jgi:DNA-binding LacI/PurR family transcriptional regulator